MQICTFERVIQTTIKPLPSNRESENILERKHYQIRLLCLNTFMAWS